MSNEYEMLLKKGIGMVRREGSMADNFKYKVAKLTPFIKISVNDLSGNHVKDLNCSFDSKIETLFALLDVEISTIVVPEYSMVILPAQLQEPLWSLGFHNGIEIAVPGIKASTQADSLKPIISSSSVPEINQVQVISSQAEPSQQTIQIPSTPINQTTTSSQIEEIDSRPDEKIEVGTQPLSTSTQLSQQNSIEDSKQTLEIDQSKEIRSSKESSPIQENNKKASATPRLENSVVYHFIVKGPSVKTFNIEENTTFSIIFDEYLTSTQDKNPSITFNGKKVSKKDTPKTINAILERQNIFELSMIEEQEPHNSVLPSENDKVKISILEQSGKYNQICFSVKQNVKIKKLLRKYCSQYKLHENDIKFSYKNKKITETIKRKPVSYLDSISPFEDAKSNLIIAKLINENK